MVSPAETKSLPVPWPEDAEIQVHIGGCHCKKIRYEFEYPNIYALPVINCNCTICEIRGHLNVFTPENRFKFTSGSADDLTTYEFGDRLLSHRFCSTCGTAIGVLFHHPQRGFVAINTRTIDGIDLSRLQLRKVDGRSFNVGKKLNENAGKT
ncbi:GFA domain-containing protein [Mycena venus]|uniref:GFA domain-containing protein n=1 Tax=Mycena venus TaxID=2733690 RepID=A0A8H7DA95_9AGAR|nr:GFA domain-containing protein [Mycena venus]